MYTCKRLTSANASLYSPLTFQYVQPRLLRLDEEPDLLAIGAESSATGQPVGLMIIHRQFATNKYHVISLFVDSAYRRKGIGTALLEETKRLLREDNGTALEIAYYGGKAITPIIEAFLQSSGWSSPSIEGKVYKADMRIDNASWLRKIGFPMGMDSFRWRDLSEAERHRLIGLEGRMYPPYLSPFKANLNLEVSNSLGLQVEGETVGWCMTYRLAEDTILYDSVFVKPEYQLSGCAFVLLGRSITLQLEQRIPYAMFAVNDRSPFMRKIVDRWLTPYTCQISEKRMAIKTL